MKKLLLLALLSLQGGIFAMEESAQAVVPFDPAKSGINIPGGSALAMCAKDAMKEMQKRSGTEIAEVVTREDFDAALAKFYEERKVSQEKQAEWKTQIAALQEREAQIEQNRKDIELNKKDISSLTTRVDVHDVWIKDNEPLIKALSAQVAHAQSGAVSLLFEAKACLRVSQMLQQCKADSFSGGLSMKFYNLVKDLNDIALQKAQLVVEAEKKKK